MIFTNDFFRAQGLPGVPRLLPPSRGRQPVLGVLLPGRQEMRGESEKNHFPGHGEIASGFGAVVIETDGGREQKGKEAEGLVSRFLSCTYLI